MKSYNTFTHGSSWVRADFHLHTRKDREFKYSGESIVNIMEGGKEAINRRKEIYALWTRQN